MFEDIENIIQHKHAICVILFICIFQNIFNVPIFIIVFFIRLRSHKTIKSKMPEFPHNVSIRIFSEVGAELSNGPVIVPSSTTSDQLQALCNELLKRVDDPVPISFRTLEGTEVLNSLQSLGVAKISEEKVMLSCWPN